MEEYNLGELATLYDSLHKTPKAYTEDGFPMIRVTDVKRGFVSLSETKKVPEEVFLEFSKKHKPITGDIIFTRVGSYGNSCYVDKDSDFCLGQNTVCITSNAEKLVPYYLYCFLNSPSAKAQIDSFISGSSQPTISLKSIKEIKVPVPSIKQQEVISKAILNYDNLIENNNCRIAILEDMAQSLYREWFVNFRYPNHEDNLDAGGNPKLVDSPLGQIPEDWEVKEFAESFDFWNGKKCAKSETGEFELYGANGIVGKAEDWKYQNAVIIGRVGAYCGAVEYCFDRFWGSDNTIIAKCKSEKNISYLFLLLEHFNLNKYAGGSAQPLLTQTTLKQLKYIAPPEELVEQFEAIAHKFFEGVVNLKKRNQNLKQQRDMLLPKLISGTIKL